MVDRREFLRSTLLSGIAITVAGCGGGGSSLASETTTAGGGVVPAPAPTADPTPPPPPAVPTLNGVTIDQAEQEIKSLFTTDLSWIDKSRQYATDVIVSSPVEFQAAINTLFDTAANPTVASLHHRIRCAWDGSASLPGPEDGRITIGKVWTTASHLDNGGSITVAAADGYAPAFANTVYIGAQGVIVQGIGFTRKPAPGELPAAISGVIPMNGTSFPMEPVVHFKDCYFGAAAGLRSMEDFSSSGLVPPAAQDVCNGVAVQGQSQFLSFDCCRFWGTLNAAKLVSRKVRIDRCDFSTMCLDAIDLFGHKYFTGYTAAAWISRCTFREPLDTWENRSQHIDAIQYCGPMDVHEGIRLLVTDCVAHLGHTFAGDPGMGGGSQGLHGAWNDKLDNQFVIRRCTFMVTAPHGFFYYSPKASRPSFVDQSTFGRAGRTPSNFAPDTQPQQDWMVGLTSNAGNAPQTGDWLLVTDTIAGNMYSSPGAKIEVVPLDPRNSAAVDLRPETVFAGRDFTRGGAAVNGIANKFGYDLPSERKSQAAFVADMWANFAPSAKYLGKGSPDMRALRWKA